ncbi:MAG: DUF1838 family protein [Myxococcota bacterium]|nr:DUF1838 family protein [Myxococcota bacterium]
MNVLRQTQASIIALVASLHAGCGGHTAHDHPGPMLAESFENGSSESGGIGRPESASTMMDRSPSVRGQQGVQSAITTDDVERGDASADMKTDNSAARGSRPDGVGGAADRQGGQSAARMPRQSLGLDLTIPADNLVGFRKTRGSMNPNDEIVFYWSGHIFLDRDEAPDAPPVSEFPGPIMRFEGFNIARFVPEMGAVRMVSREMAVYKDLSGRILNCWNNRPLGLEEPQYVPVVHVFNDPVNHTITGGSAHQLGDDVTWSLEVMLRYPSPLPIIDFPEYSASNTYEASELFNFYTKMSDLNDPSLDTVPVTLSWTRIGQFLPWMKAGQASGKLIYHTFGKKILNGFDGLPEDLRAYVLDVAPEFARAPSVDEAPNATSWRVFRQLVQSGAYEPMCP